MDLLIRQMVSSISERDGLLAIENALQWLRQECRCERAMFYQFKGSLLLTFAASNLAPAEADFFRGERQLAEDPVIRCYRNQLGFLDWRDALRQYPASVEYLQMLQRSGLLPAQSYGYTSQCSATSGVISVCTLGAMQRSLNSDDKYLLSSLVPVLHMVGRGTRMRGHSLTERELEILRWAREGRTTAEIALIREVSESTVKYHLKTIYGKLGVANRAQAVGEALCRGLI
ncbi:LuxR C-terminal-related transcriptional regulator [Pseudomonas sp. 21LCFQ02]|uniref:helix-turn-helix transcriptional regulator n=1 Tax=unclassified Pseudomonas TaxID=196821 RepID=UPI002097093C|nr:MULTISPECIES: LuxR family transcriptional regulator [unclassified Pseudomonas]MCO8160631.1 LuxR C-terminal-related transcriptional regulator [Pseudomonas sp. 21LCFQ010]MCO8170120.1 LuxR C-terminal-related transcriptional regulator [Pseudomonas sp. 21LCFQ02]